MLCENNVCINLTYYKKLNRIDFEKAMPSGIFTLYILQIPRKTLDKATHPY